MTHAITPSDNVNVAHLSITLNQSRHPSHREHHQQAGHKEGTYYTYPVSLITTNIIILYDLEAVIILVDLLWYPLNLGW